MGQTRGPPGLIVTTGSKLPVSSKLLAHNDDLKTIVVTTSKGAAQLNRRRSTRNLIIWELPENNNGQVDITRLLDHARQFGMKSLLIEGGQSLTTSFVKAKLVDKWVAMIAPRLTGTGISQLGDLKISKISNGLSFKNTKYEQIGSDMMFTGYPVWESK